MDKIAAVIKLISTQFSSRMNTPTGIVTFLCAGSHFYYPIYNLPSLHGCTTQTGHLFAVHHSSFWICYSQICIITFIKMTCSLKVGNEELAWFCAVAGEGPDFTNFGLSLRFFAFELVIGKLNIDTV